MKKASSEGILQYQIMCVVVRCILWLLTSLIASSAPKSREELQEQLKIVILDEAAINDATQKLPKSLRALLEKLAQPSALPLSELVRCLRNQSE